jgi:hypothetical protein
MKKIIFLDFDGVITTLKSRWRLDIEKLNLLGEILDKTGAQLVISSSWRQNNVENTINQFKDKTRYFNNNMEFPYCDKIIGVTKYVPPKKMSDRHLRGDEIQLWIDENLKGKEYNYCILDDDMDMIEEQLPYFVNTYSETGLSNEDVEKAIQILNKNE